MGITRRRDSLYVAFPVVPSDDGKTLRLARGAYGAKVKRWKVGCFNRRVAQEMAASIKAQLLAGKVPTTDAPKAVTFRAWSKTYLSLEEVASLRSFSTRKIHVTHLLKFFGDKLLTAIASDDVRKYRAWRSAQGVAIQTVNHDHTALTHMLNVAMSEQFNLIVRNVAALVPKPDPRNERDRLVSAEEWTAIKQHAAPHLARFLTVAYALGPRRGELLHLEWPDVDMKRREFTLRKTKNDEARTVPMTPEVHEVFKQCWKERRLGETRVFLYRGKPIVRLNTAFKNACRRAGILAGRKDGGLIAHDFRHSAATTMRRAGLDTMTAMKIVGHKSEKMHRRYNQITPDDLREAVDKLVTYRKEQPTKRFESDTVMTLDKLSTDR